MRRLTSLLLAVVSIAIGGCKNGDSSSTTTATSAAASSTKKHWWATEPWSPAQHNAADFPQTIEGLPDNTFILDQGWDTDTVQKYWFTPQGSEMIPRAWLLALKRPNGERFATNATFDKYRYMPASPTAYNPDGWPVGIAVSTDPASKVQWVGYTCAGCHSGRLDYGGKSVILTGGATLANLSGLLGDMIDTMTATANNDAMFLPFAAQVLGPNNSQYARNQLKNEVTTLASSLNVRKEGMIYSGYGRLDAFGTIFNQVMATDLGLPNHQRFADGSVSYPFIWDSSHTDRVQWNGAVSNRGFQGPIGRNVAEIMGVFGNIIIDPSRSGGYSSSIDFKTLGEIEKWLKGLWSPQWPEKILPPLDQAKVARGKTVYSQQCISCHALTNRTDKHRSIHAVMTPIGVVGTDPRMATNFAQRTGQTGRLEGQKSYYIVGKKMGAEEQGLAFIFNAAVGAMFVHKEQALKAAIEDYEGLYLDQGKYDPVANPSYKSRPLNGAWGTAPYLHNGSVANLWDLLQPVERRAKSFYVGSYNFDPVKVGYETGPSPISSLFTASGVGNSNAGHTYGTQLTDAQKWDLIEYLKSL